MFQNPPGKTSKIEKNEKKSLNFSRKESRFLKNRRNREILDRSITIDTMIIDLSRSAWSVYKQ